MCVYKICRSIEFSRDVSVPMSSDNDISLAIISGLYNIGQYIQAIIPGLFQKN